MTVAGVKLWGTLIGAVALDSSDSVATFEYTPDFAAGGVEVAPLMMPLATTRYRFAQLNRASFHGLPGLLADSLPDRYGHALIDAWLAREGRPPESFDAVERLCYVGQRGMGALEFEPVLGPTRTASHPIEIASLVELASEVLSDRTRFAASFDDDERERAIRDLLLVGTSAGGARAKAVIAWNPATNEVRSGQVSAEAGFQHWLLKFDGVSGNKDRELEDPRGYGAIEYAYALMARDAGVTLTESHLLEENGRRHFMTRRFDRLEDGGKLHMQSLAAIAHFDFNLAGAYAYEQAFDVCRRLGLGVDTNEQLFRRMLFNVVARNQDDHVKNIAFLMNRRGDWRLSPAFDVTYAFQPSGLWTARHQMTVNGKQDEFTIADFEACARAASLKRGQATALLDQVIAVVRSWPGYAAAIGVPDEDIVRIGRAHRLAFARS